MSHSNSPIARAIAELETERAHLKARLVHVDDAIVCLRKLFHLPAHTADIKLVAKSPARDIPAEVLAALVEQPLAPAALAMAVGIDVHTLRTHVSDLERAGKVIYSGATINRRIALAAPAAKEALRR